MDSEKRIKKTNCDEVCINSSTGGKFRDASAMRIQKKFTDVFLKTQEERNMRKTGASH